MKTAVVVVATAVFCALPHMPSTASASREQIFEFADPRIVESSGLATSVVHPGIVWTHNDSGSAPHIYAIDAGTGNTVAVVTLRHVIPVDVEAIAMGRDDAGRPALFVADTGTSVPVGGYALIHRFTEPSHLVDQTVDVSTYRVDFGQQPRPDVEALLVDPRDNRVYLVSKDPSAGRVFQGPPKLSPDTVNVFTAVGSAPALVSDGTFLPDGRVVVRSNIRARILDGPSGQVLATMALPIAEAGESLALTPDGASLIVGTEGMRSPVWRIPLGPHASAPSPTPQPSPSPTPSPAPVTPTPAPTMTDVPSATSSAGVDGSVQAGFVIAAVAAVALLIAAIRRRSTW